jgi:hypothetical protein
LGHFVTVDVAMGRQHHQDWRTGVGGQQLECSYGNISYRDGEWALEPATRVEHELRGDPVGLAWMDLMRVAANTVVVVAMLGSCAGRKVETTMSEDKRMWGQPISGCRVSIARTGSADEKDSVKLHIVFQNRNSKAVGFPRSSLWFDYDFSVVDATGATVPLTAFGEQERENMMAAAALAEVGPGQEYDREVEISRLYKLDRVGSYMVQASKTFRDPATSQFVTASSNRLPIEVPRRAER